MRQAVHISSVANPKVKLLLSLDKPKNRRSMGLTMVEGAKEIEMALAAKMDFDSVFFVPEIASLDLINSISSKNPQIGLFSLSQEVFNKLTYRESTGGVIALVKIKSHELSSLKLKDNPLLLIIDGVEKPGNLGAMLRTADASATDAVICCDMPGDLYNPNIIRASLGTVFTVPVAVCSGEEARYWLKTNNIKTYCSNLHRSNDYFAEDYTGPTAIVVGTEATGVSDAWIDFADKNVKVPMLGKIDSMNVSVAAAIMLYEARRQRMKI